MEELEEKEEEKEELEEKKERKEEERESLNATYNGRSWRHIENSIHPIMISQNIPVLGIID